jgi:hypothetical protein
MERVLTEAELEQRRAAAVRHGGFSEARIRAKARAHRRRFLRHLGARASDLDAIARARLDHWARGQAQLDLFDSTGERGTRNYWTAFNGVTRVLRDLEQCLVTLDRAPARGRVVRAGLIERYGGSP